MKIVSLPWSPSAGNTTTIAMALWERRISVADGDLSYFVISLPDLIANKRALGRYQDLADLEELDGAPKSF